MRALARANLKEVDSRGYFALVHELGIAGENVTAAALHVLDDPSFEIFLPEHYLRLGQNYVLVYLLLIGDADLWIPRALERLEIERDAKAQKSLALALFYAQDDRADAALKRFAAHELRPAESRELAQQLMARISGTAPPKERQFDSIARARAAIRERLKGVSDEALHDLDDFTRELIALRREAAAN